MHASGVVQLEDAATGTAMLRLGRGLVVLSCHWQWVLVLLASSLRPRRRAVLCHTQAARLRTRSLYFKNERVTTLNGRRKPLGLLHRGVTILVN